VAERFRAFGLRTEGGTCRFEFQWVLFFILFVSIYFLFLCVMFFSTSYFSILSPFFSSIDFFKFQNSSVFSPCNDVTGAMGTLCTLAGT
jgi:hypothetical protein